MDVLRNRTQLINLGDQGIQFIGSPSYPTTYITAQVSADQQQWVITNIEVVESATKLEPLTQPKKVIKADQQDTSLPVISFTNHAQDVLKRTSLEHRIIEHIIQYPDEKYDEDDEKVRFSGSSDGKDIHIIAKFLARENKWLVITVKLYNKGEANPSNAPVGKWEFDSLPNSQYPGVRFSIHARERMELRKIHPNEVRETLFYPQETYPDDEEKVKFIKKLSHRYPIHVIGRFLPEENTWLIVTVWVRGEEDDGSISAWGGKRNDRGLFMPRSRKSDAIPYTARASNRSQRSTQPIIRETTKRDMNKLSIMLLNILIIILLLIVVGLVARYALN